MTAEIGDQQKQIISQILQLLESCINNGDLENAVKLSMEFIENKYPCIITLDNVITEDRDFQPPLEEVNIIPEKAKEEVNDAIMKKLLSKGIARAKAKFAATGVSSMEEAMEKAKLYKA